MTDAEGDHRSERSKTLGLIRFPRAAYLREHGWQPAELRLLGKLPDAEVARRTGRTVEAVRSKRGMLGFPNPESPAWTADELALFGTFPDAEIVGRTGRSRGAVSAMRWKLKKKRGRS